MTHTGLRVLTLNIHKGFDQLGVRFTLKAMRDAIRAVDADIVCLQEVHGHHDRLRDHLPTTAQFEYLADQVWHHYAYGKNAVYDEGHHGNAILSKFPFRGWENLDVSTNSFERRGILHAEIDWPGGGREPLHVMSVHFNLFERSRRRQIEVLGRRIAAVLSPHSPVVVAGDFNDWRLGASGILKKDAGLDECFTLKEGRPAATFPALFPRLRLDRIYFRGLGLKDAAVLAGGGWARLSDHAALTATFDVLPPG